MKTSRTFLTLFVSAVVILGSLSGACTKEDRTNPCDNTKASSKSISLKMNVRIVTQDGSPVSGAYVEIRIERNACGANDAVDVSNFNGTTNEQGNYSSSTVTLTLDNTMDDAFMTVIAPNLSSSKNFSNKTYTYNDFDDGDSYVVDIELVEDL